MARPKTIPDTEVFHTVLRLLAEAGEQGLSHAAVGRACGLAPATLVQRFGTQSGMVQAAIHAGWEAADAALAEAEATAGKSLHKLLKALPDCTELLAVSRRDAALRLRAADWRLRVERLLAARLGNGAKTDETAALLFALWQGQSAWAEMGGKGFRLKEAAKRLI